MLHRLIRLFIIKSKFEAFLVIYALAVGAVQRGMIYLKTSPGMSGWLMFVACTLVVMMAGPRILDSVEREQADI